MAIFTTQKEIIENVQGEIPSKQRAVLAQHFKAVLKKNEDDFARMLHATPTDGQALITYRAHFMDRLVQMAFNCVNTLFFENIHKPKIAILSVGGYGRGELAPYSDIDLMALISCDVDQDTGLLVEIFYYLLWDIGLHVGHASRTISDCLKVGREDMTVRSALLEQRYLVGNSELAEELPTRLQRELFTTTISEFIEAKLVERSTRHEKHGGQRYMLEPNIKEGKGGLRDLQSMFWIAKYIHNVDKAEALVNLGLFRAEEFSAFSRAHSFLWAVRTHMHHITQRATNQLTFDLQVDVAKAMGYADHGGRLAVEHFMQNYFLHATRVGELTRIFLTALEAIHVKKLPLYAGSITHKRYASKIFCIRQNRLSYIDENIFDRDPLNILRVFEEAVKTGYLLHPDVVRLIPLKRKLIDIKFRQNSEAHAIFFRLLLDYGDPARALRRMNECGVLSSFLPDFKPIMAMMQFNFYHSYTVDEHIFQAIMTLSEIEKGQHKELLPHSHDILQNNVDRKVLYLALLLHDIGKGREEDHSILGARIALQVARDLGLNKQRTETVRWLVRNHLLMSDMAQKRDVSDPRTTYNFAQSVGSKERLDLLFLLTCCDINAVGPGVLNVWKCKLLHTLYWQTVEALNEKKSFEKDDMVEITAMQKHLERALDAWPKAKRDAEIARHHQPYWRAFSPQGHEAFAHLLDALSNIAESNEKISFDIMADEARDVIHIYFATYARKGVFAHICGALALVGANVIDARTYNTKDGYVTAAFDVQNIYRNCYENVDFEELRTKISKRLEDGTTKQTALIDKDKIKKRERHFVVPTTIVFNNDDSELYTIIEINTRDRPGLLYDLSKTLLASNIQIDSAIIATYGAEAVDSFYIKDTFGLKLLSKSRQEKLCERLQKAIDIGAERAIA